MTAVSRIRRSVRAGDRGFGTETLRLGKLAGSV
jgi:hypothetical protein